MNADSEGKKALEIALNLSQHVNHISVSQKARKYVADLEAERDRLLDQQERLMEVLWQLLDDMGDDGLCVCKAAKDDANAAYDEIASTLKDTQP